MNMHDFDRWAREVLELERFRAADDSLNGIQVDRSDTPLRKMAFAVDACLETIRRAKEAGAQALFVHHGLFWGKPLPLSGSLRQRVLELLTGDLALYACHLPLDAHPELGNNAVLARMLGLKDIEPFGEYHGLAIGCKGNFEKPLSLDEALRRVLSAGDPPRALYPFGPERIRSVGIVSGGAAFESLQAIEQGLDLYLTGEPSHSIYHTVMEEGLNVIAAGHYATEVHGVQAVAERAARELGIETVFIEFPTGL